MFQKVSIIKHTWAFHRRLHWCNENLSNSVLPNTTEPCFLVALVPRLTLYLSSTGASLERASPGLPSCLLQFLPAPVGLSPATAFTGKESYGWGCVRSFCLQDFQAKLKLFLNSTAQFLASLQQLTSLASVSL